MASHSSTTVTNFPSAVLTMQRTCLVNALLGSLASCASRMVVICAGTTGYNLTMDARYLWMHQKRVQGSHFANLLQAAQANKLVVERRVDPATSEVFPWEQIPKAHMRMWRNEHKPGNMAVLVSAPTTGLRTYEDVLEASRKRFG